MKRFLLLLCLFLFGTALYAQTSYRNPRVDSQYQSDYGIYNVQGVIMGDEGTYVILEAITSRGYSGLTISFSDQTYLTYSGKRVRIKAWGYWDGDDMQEKEFNEQYSLRADRRYNFVMIFPRIPSNTKVFSVKENVSGGFYWNGIHLDGSTAENGSGYGSGLNSGSGSNSGSGYGSGSGSYDPGYDSKASFEPVGSGTCFAISSDGYLATCYHVVEGAHRFMIRGINGDYSKMYSAKVVTVDRENDLAILKIQDRDFTSFKDIPYVVSSQIADVGEDVFVLGYPLRPVMGDEIKLTNGVISSKSGYQGDATSYQTSATVQPGNSGGPLFNSDGFVVGVVNARLGVESASYAVKSPYLRKLAASVGGIKFATTNKLAGKSLKDKVKDITKFILIIEVE